MENRTRGFTLIELMVGILVLSILVAIAVPSFRSYAVDSRMSAASSDLVTTLNLARSEALRRSGPVRVCASADGATCSGATDWTIGWVVFADRNGNGTPDDEELVQVWDGPQAGVTMSSTAASVGYNAMGMAVSAATFTTTHDSCTGTRARESVLSVSGSLQTRKVVCPSP